MTRGIEIQLFRNGHPFSPFPFLRGYFVWHWYFVVYMTPDYTCRVPSYLPYQPSIPPPPCQAPRSRAEKSMAVPPAALQRLALIGSGKVPIHQATLSVAIHTSAPLIRPRPAGSCQAAPDWQAAQLSGFEAGQPPSLLAFRGTGTSLCCPHELTLLGITSCMYQVPLLSPKEWKYHIFFSQG